LRLSREQFDQIVAHALENREQESCGILAGQNGSVVAIHRARNTAETPRTRFTMDPHDILKISDEIDAAGQDLMGFYHSHTHTQAYPSPTDVADWPARWYPDAYCLICSLMEESRPTIRAFKIGEDGKIVEEPLEVE
jgi:proteasome lid subunit RPN8/RPN11